MKKEVTIIRCDGAGCQNYIEWDTLANSTDVKNLLHPPSWYVVKQANEAGKLMNGYFDLCSLACVSKWGKERAVAVGEKSSHSTKGKRYNKKACPVCEQELAAQGLFQHYSANADHQEVSSYEEFRKTWQNS